MNLVERFKRGDFVIMASSQEEGTLVCKYLYSQGFQWSGGNGRYCLSVDNGLGMHGSKTTHVCYGYYKGAYFDGITRGDKWHYEEKGIRIMTGYDFLHDNIY